MCGIVGFALRKSIDFNRDLEKIDLLKRMIQTVLHRGPDIQSYYRDNNCYLGFTRLILVGGRKSMQPLHNEDKTLYLICNGEIYNHKELRQELEKKGHAFSTFSDCEVILHLYEECQEDLVHKLQGQFAFVLWDKKEKRIYAVRDRFGICPLFYAYDGNRFIFASEIKAVLEDSHLSRGIDPQGIAETAFIYGATPPRTCFKGVQILPQAHMLSLDLIQWQLTVKQYWQPPFLTKKSQPVKNQDMKAIQKQLKFKLQSVIERYINHGEEPVSISISGGIDSSTLAYFSSKAQNRITTSFGIEFLDKNLDESYFQRKLANLLKFDHHEMVCDDSTIVNNLPATIWHTECPLFRTAPIPLLAFSKFIHKFGFKAVLSGEGADELFCGYPIFFEGEIRTIFKNHKNDIHAKKQIEQFLHKEISNTEFDEMKEKYYSDPKIIPGFLSHYSRWMTTKQLLSLFKTDFLQENADKIALKRLTLFMGDNYDEVTSLAWAQHAEIITKQAGYVLSTQGDRVSMANAVEKRLPYLDNEIAPFVLQIDESFRQHGKEDKYILRKMMHGLLPEEFIARPKQGYLAPTKTPFLGDKTRNTYIADLLSDSEIKKAGYFNPKMVKDICLQFGSASNNSKFIETAFIFILSMQVLHALFIEKRSDLFLGNN